MSSSLRGAQGPQQPAEGKHLSSALCDCASSPRNQATLAALCFYNRQSIAGFSYWIQALAVFGSLCSCFGSLTLL